MHYLRPAIVLLAPLGAWLTWQYGALIAFDALRGLTREMGDGGQPASPAEGVAGLWGTAALGIGILAATARRCRMSAAARAMIATSSLLFFAAACSVGYAQVQLRLIFGRLARQQSVVSPQWLLDQTEPIRPILLAGWGAVIAASILVVIAAWITPPAKASASRMPAALGRAALALLALFLWVASTGLIANAHYAITAMLQSDEPIDPTELVVFVNQLFNLGVIQALALLLTSLAVGALAVARAEGRLPSTPTDPAEGSSPPAGAARD